MLLIRLNPLSFRLKTNMHRPSPIMAAFLCVATWHIFCVVKHHKSNHSFIVPVFIPTGCINTVKRVWCLCTNDVIWFFSCGIYSDDRTSCTSYYTTYAGLLMFSSLVNYPILCATKIFNHDLLFPLPRADRCPSRLIPHIQSTGPRGRPSTSKKNLTCASSWRVTYVIMIFTQFVRICVSICRI
jgi:hypothetical protein